MRRRNLAVFPLLATLAGGTAQSQPRLPRAILRVTGRIAEDQRDYTLESLEALGLREMSTRTAWTGPDAVPFSGVPLLTLLRDCGATGRALRIQALNDYAVNLPFEDAEEHEALLATRQGGQPLRVRDRGPIWLIYAWSDRPALDTPVYRERSIWQIRQIDVL